MRAVFLLQRHMNGIAAVSHQDALRWVAEDGAVPGLDPPEPTARHNVTARRLAEA